MSRLDDLELEIAQLSEKIKKCDCGSKGKSRKGGTHTKITAYQMCVGNSLLRAEKGDHKANFKRATGLCSVTVKGPVFDAKGLAREYISELQKIKKKGYEEKIERVKLSFGV